MGASVGPTPVVLEVLHLERPAPSSLMLGARRSSVPAPAGFTAADPNRAAAVASGLAGEDAEGPGDATWVHSTSWRVDGAAVVLTFLAFGADVARTAGWEPLDPVDPAVSPGRTTTVTLPRVLHHAMRHLAFLAARDAALRGQVEAAGLTRVLLADLSPAGVLPERG